VSGSCKLTLKRNSTGALIQSAVTCLIAKLQNNGIQPLIGNLATTFSSAFHHVYILPSVHTLPTCLFSLECEKPMKLQNSTVVGVTDYYSQVVLSWTIQI